MSNIVTALQRFEKAVETNAFKGAQPPEDWPRIEKEYEASKTFLMQAISDQGAYRFRQGQKDGLSRARNRPGDGDMGG